MSIYVDSQDAPLRKKNAKQAISNHKTHISTHARTHILPLLRGDARAALRGAEVELVGLVARAAV